MIYRTLLLGLIALLLVPVVAAQTVADCVADYDATVDYFPEKVTVTEAENFDVTYENHYKVVTVDNNGETYTYVLTQCGTPAPTADEFPDGTQFIDLPAGNIIALSTTQLPQLVELGLLENLVGLGSFAYVGSEDVIERIDAGDVTEVSPNFELNVELVLSAEPDIVMTDGFSTETLSVLIDSGVFTVVNTDYLEASPLGRAEWLKFVALFYNSEAEANELYDEIATNYADAQAIVADVADDDRPLVLYNTFSTFDDAWIVPGAETYAGQLLRDAGAEIALGEEAPEQSAFLSFEVVYDAALEADVWILNAFAIGDLDSFLAQDARYADFAAAEAGQVWNNDLDVNANGGNDYYERGVLRPDLILLDLIAIFYPERLPEHEFEFFRQIAG